MTRQTSALVCWLLEVKKAAGNVEVPYPLALRSFADLERKQFHRISRGRSRYPDADGQAKWRWRPELSPWQEYLQNEATNEEGTLLNDEFRRQFRVPKCMFDGFLADMKASGSFLDPNDHKRTGPKPHPLDVKLLAVLRAMALGVPIDGVCDAARISGSTISDFFLHWSEWFVGTYYSHWVRIPRTEEELKSMEELFRKCGLPGCFTSMDGVHLHGDRLPAGNRHDYVGKEGFPTVAFNCHCTHNCRLVYIGPAQPGARNDKTMVLFDELVREVRTNPLFTDYTFELMNDEGEMEQVKGAWVLCDGGYHNWRATITGLKHGSTFEQRLFSKSCESIRKDIERVFGMMKRRWRILRVPISLQSEHAISLLFRTCGILHNMLMDFDGTDQHGMDEDDWILQDLESTYMTYIREGRKVDKLPPINADFFRRGCQAMHTVPTDVEAGFHELRGALITHMAMMKERGELQWLKKLSDKELRDI